MNKVEAPKWFRDALDTPFEDRTVTVQGCPVHYMRWGDRAKPGILLVHGGAAHAKWWSFIAPKLTSEFHVAAIDLSGHGDSGKREDYPRELWAEELMEVCRDAGFVGAPVVVGHSMGGFVAIVTAALYGDRLAGAVVVDSPVRRPDPERQEGSRGKAFRSPGTYDSLEEAIEHFHLIPPQPCDNDYIVDHVARNSLHEVDGAWHWKFDPRVFLRMNPRAIAEYLANTRCRLAILRAEHSDLVTPDVSDYMYELLDRNAPIVTIPECHHHLILDQPLAFIAALRALLADWEHSVPRRRS